MAALFLSFTQFLIDFFMYVLSSNLGVFFVVLLVLWFTFSLFKRLMTW